MGKCAETIAASSGDSENNERDSCQAHNVGGFTEEDRSGCTGEVGEDTGAAEEGGIETTEPAASMRQAFMLEVSC
jgi:hypothetical protein